MVKCKQLENVCEGPQEFFVSTLHPFPMFEIISKLFKRQQQIINRSTGKYTWINHVYKSKTPCYTQTELIIYMKSIKK